jgi:acetyltransferase-like isoleucine patch superfamily enzyme
MQDYSHDDYFLESLEGLINVPSTCESLPISPEKRAADYWRLLNPHNETTLVLSGVIDLNKICVGRKTYGKLSLWGFGNLDESLTVGSFVSIAEDVRFLLGGNHEYQGFSTFPFLAKYFATNEATTKGAIVVGDDVWIGYNSVILSGVTIGQGAIVAAGSIVTRNVAPYSIVGGNPAKLIKYRFDQAIIDELCNFNFSLLTDEAILRNKEILYEKLDSENVSLILKKLI